MSRAAAVGVGVSGVGRRVERNVIGKYYSPIRFHHCHLFAHQTP